MSKFAKILSLALSFVLMMSIGVSALNPVAVRVTDIDESTAGTVSLWLDNLSAEAVRACLIVVLENTANGRTEKINCCAKEVPAGERELLSASVGAPAASQRCRYYLWETATRMPLLNQAPGEISAPEITRGMTSLQLSWAAADDDKQAVSHYNLYKLNDSTNQFEKISTTSDCAYTVEHLEHGQKAAFKVETVDAENAVSEQVLLESTTKRPLTSLLHDGTEVDRVNQNWLHPQEDEGLRLWCADSGKFGYLVPGDFGGRSCAVSTETDRGGGSMAVGIAFFDIQSASGIYEATPENPVFQKTPVVVEVTYFDEGTDNLRLAYNTANGTNDGYMPLKRTDTGIWKTKAVTLADAEFFNGKVSAKANNSSTGDNYVNFRIQNGNGSKPGMAICRVTVSKAEEYESPAAYIDASQGIEARDMVFKPGLVLVQDQTQEGKDKTTADKKYPMYNRVTYENGDSVLTVKDGRGAMCLNNYEITMDDDRKLQGQSSAVLELTYFDEGSGTVRANYWSKSGKATQELFMLTNTATWKKATVTLTDINFNGGAMPTQSGAKADFEVGTTDGSPLYLTKLRAY